MLSPSPSAGHRRCCLRTFTRGVSHHPGEVGHRRRRAGYRRFLPGGREGRPTPTVAPVTVPQLAALHRQLVDHLGDGGDGMDVADRPRDISLIGIPLQRCPAASRADHPSPGPARSWRRRPGPWPPVCRSVCRAARGSSPAEVRNRRRSRPLAATIFRFHRVQEPGFRWC